MIIALFSLVLAQAAEPAAINYSTVNQRVFTPKCVQCHKGFATYEGILEKIQKIELKVANNLMPPPDKAAPLSNEERALVLDWIRLGAPRN